MIKKQGGFKLQKYNLMEAKQKAENYCSYRERSQQEVKEKLYDWGIPSQGVNEIIAELITENYLNERRFAEGYARGKFNLNGWGKIKITYGLRGKGITENLIKHALAQIEQTIYLEKLEDILLKKDKQLKDSDAYIRKMKLARFAASRGFESTFIFEVLENIQSE